MSEAVLKRVGAAGAMDNRRGVLLCGIAIFAVFFVLYFATSTVLSKTVAFQEDDILFELDTPRVIRDMTLPEANHYRSKVHPLYVLLMNPVGALAKKLIGSDVNAAVLLNSLLGAAGVTLGFIFFWLYTKTLMDASLLAFLFGLSASQLILSIVPDTASLAICSLLLTYILFLLSLRSRPPRLFWWILAGVFSLGVTTTNFAQTAICFAVSDFVVHRQQGVRRLGIRLLSFLGGVLLIVTLLAVLQKALYPSTVLFFLPEAYREDLRYASWLVFQSPLTVGAQLFKNFAWLNFIAPDPTIYALPNHQLPAVTFSRSLDFSVPGIIGSLLWFGLWIAQIAKESWLRLRGAARQSSRRPLGWGFLLCLLFNLALHSFYGVGEKGGIEYFLYTGNFTFLVLALWAIPLELPQKALRMLLATLIICVGLNNLWVVKGITSLFAGL